MINKTKNKKILFVCTGNTCRSPMAEIILKNKIKFAGIEGVKVSSAGLAVDENSKINPNSKIALKNLGYTPKGFKPKQITEDMIKKSDMVICMTSEQKARLKQFDNVYTIGDVSGLNDVEDPFGKDLIAYIKVSHVLEDVCNVILNEIIKVKGE